MKQQHLIPIALFAASAVCLAQSGGRSDEEILKGVKLPDGYIATVFAKPPSGGYPTSVSAAPDGTLFVAVDENGSIDTKPGRGRVVRCIDTDGDGRADEFSVFAEMDSPRGVIWDGASGKGPGTLYVMHPPNLTAYRDTDGDGHADEQEDIVTGLGFDLKFRGADHTTNGCRLGIDGFIYIAVGDYGYIEAKGKDGTTIRNRGGGVVRVRPDGTGLEIVSRGQRNIYDVAVSPMLDLFTRDNTNDGGGWDTRLSYVPPGAHMGYPTLFVNFPEDMLQPLADYGGGAPCGALWIDEPGLQNGLYTVEWGRNAIMFHGLKPQGAGWKVEGPNQGQTEWLQLQRPTDMDVDGAGRIYISSWEGATFTYNGPNVGYVLRVVKKDAPVVTVPNVDTASGDELGALINSPSATLRLAAQRALLRRVHDGEKPAVRGMARATADRDALAERTAWFATMVQIQRTRKLDIDAGLDWAASAHIRLSALKLIDSTPSFNTPKLARFVSEALEDSDAAVRAAAIVAARRAALAMETARILPLVADADPVVSHLAVRVLSEWRAVLPCLAALDSSEEKLKPGALRVLYGIYDSAVVDGLIARLGGAQNAELRRGIVNALCRLDNEDADYVDPKVWWGTRPDTSGPVYKPERWSESEKIEVVLRKELDAAQGADALALAQLMLKTKVNLPDLAALMLAKAGGDAAAKIAAIEMSTAAQPGLPDEPLRIVQEIARDEKQSPEVRAKALRLLQSHANWPRELDAALNAFAPLAGRDISEPALATAFESFTRDAKLGSLTGELEKSATGADAARRTIAQTVLVNLATGTLASKEHKAAAAHALENMWSKPESAASLLAVIARTKTASLADQVLKRLKDPNNAVAEAALFAYQALGLKDSGTPMAQIAGMKYEDVFAAVQKGGDAAQGREVFLRAGCIACHTVGADEPPKGPILSAVAKIYDRAALTESILKPNAKIAQGFESVWVKTKKGEMVEGFVTREGGDSLDLRNVAGQVVTIEKGDIAERGKRDTSIMPEGLLNASSPADLANLLAYLESLKAAK